MNHKLYFIITLFIISGCASKPPKVPTFEEAVKEGDIESGWYTKKNRENVYVDVQAPRQKQEEAEKKAFDLQREADYAKRQNDQLQYENMLLRVRGNYKLEKEVNELQGFDNQNNPVIRQKTLNPEPQQRPVYIDKSTDRVKVQYNDPTRLTNETTYPVGHAGPNAEYPRTVPNYPQGEPISASAKKHEVVKPVESASQVMPVESVQAAPSPQTFERVPASGLPKPVIE